MLSHKRVGHAKAAEGTQSAVKDATKNAAANAATSLSASSAKGFATGAITRRGLFRTTAATGIAAAVMGIASGCHHSANEGAGKALEISEDAATKVLDAYASKDYTSEPAQSYTLALGSVLRPAEGDWIPLTSAGTTATPMVVASALSLASGSVVEVVTQTQMNATTAVIYDVGCSDALYAWVELDTSTRDWTLYVSGFSEGKLTDSAVALYQGSHDYDPASFAVSGKTIVWIVEPALSGSKTAEKSYCYVWSLGDKESVSAVESNGRFATAPSISNGVVVLTPRVQSGSAFFYGVVAYQLSDNLKTKLDQITMPQSVKPYFATRIGDKFLISVEKSYDSGGLLGKMGTYILPSSGEGVLCIDREPLAGLAGKEGLYIVKSRASYVLVDTVQQACSWLYATDRSLDYGEFPAREGECSSFVTFSTTKNPDSGYPASVTVRHFPL